MIGAHRAIALAAALAATGCGAAAGAGDADAGGATTLTAEAGFFELPAAKVPGPSGKSRMFYSFRPADRDAEAAPLVVFFNGGPGEATSAILLPFGTGPTTLDADPHAAPHPAPNPASWTRFANLLYLDSRLAGFSYAEGDAGCSFDARADENQRYYLVDAGDFVLGILDFLDAHPALTSKPVVVVGESYGGTRAMLVELLLLHYADPLPPDPTYPLPAVDEVMPWLVDRVQRHVDLERDGGASAPVAEMAKQFGHAVLLEPVFGGEDQSVVDAEMEDPDLAPYFAHPNRVDRYDVRLSAGEARAISAHAATAMRDPATLRDLLGVDPANVEGLRADQRVGAVRAPGSVTAAVVADENEIRAALGALGKWDAYWIEDAEACLFLQDAPSNAAALALFPELELFMTRARYDAAVQTEALVQLWQSAGLTATIDEQTPKGAARPGVLTLGIGQRTAEIRFPKYEAGHEISRDQPAALASDVEAWLESNRLLP